MFCFKKKKINYLNGLLLTLFQQIEEETQQQSNTRPFTCDGASSSKIPHIIEEKVKQIIDIMFPNKIVASSRRHKINITKNVQQCCFVKACLIIANNSRALNQSK